MTLGDAITQYIAFNQALGMRFHVDAGLLRMLYRQVGEIELAAPHHDSRAASGSESAV